MTDDDRERFSVAGGRHPGLVREMLAFILEHKKWWLLPIVLSLLLLSGMVFLGGSGAAPFIYTLF